MFLLFSIIFFHPFIIYLPLLLLLELAQERPMPLQNRVALYIQKHYYKNSNHQNNLLFGRARLGSSLAALPQPNGSAAPTLD